MQLIGKAFKITFGILLALMVFGFVMYNIQQCGLKKNLPPQSINSSATIPPTATTTPTNAPPTPPKIIESQPRPKRIRYCKGKNGGCYYVNDKGRRVYVDASACR